MTRRGLRGTLAVGALLLASGASPAHAAPELVWNAPPGCPDAAAVRAAAARVNARVLVANVRALGAVRRAGTGYELALTLSARSGSAELHLAAERCDTLADVVALEVALAADAASVTLPLAPAPGPAKPRLGATLAAGASVGPLPGVSPSLRAGVALDLAEARLEIGAKYGARREVTYPPGVLGARLELLAAFARICSPVAAAGFGVAVCGGGEAGGVRGTGFGVPETFTTTRLWGALAAAPVIRYALASGVSVFADAELALALTRPEFHARGLPTLFQSDRTAASLWLGVGDAF